VERVEGLLQRAAVESPDVEARWILESAIGRRLGPVVTGGFEVDPAAVDGALAMSARRAAGEPIQYVTGTAGFRRLLLNVGPGVFIPRPETELVAERAMELLPQGGLVVDVGTGSGAIALSIADERPDARVHATESSAEALRWAEKNLAAWGLRVNLAGGDLLAGLSPELRGSFDVVVSNPPYVAEGDGLPPEVADHEPREALFSGLSGTGVIAALAAQAGEWLHPGGWLVLEVGDTQGAAASGILEGLGFSQVSIRTDLTGRDRIASGRLDGPDG
jgi:release factor glutamine methyltransferase